MEASDAIAALLRFDRPGLEAAVQSRRAARLDAPSNDEAALEHELDEAWLAIAQGRAVDDLDQLERRAATAGLASLVVRVAAAQALGLATSGQLEHALQVARRASRMGRTEAVPEAEYLAALVLARVRRLTGRPYLATRILTALASYAPPPWHGWLAWELLMASGSHGPLTPSGMAATLTKALGHLDQGHAAHWRTTVQALTAGPGLTPLRQDLQRLVAALDPEVASDDVSLGAWIAGQPPHEPPYGLLGLEGASGGSAAAYVLAGAGRNGRRMLQRGAPLMSGAHAMPPTQRRQARVDGLLAGLALAAPGAVEEEELFGAVYGFRYARNVHKEVLHVAIHRARERLGDHGAIERAGSRLKLELGGPVLFPDPRCAPAVDDRVLQFVAKRGSITAKEAAGALGIPLRSAQSALKELVEGGACKQRREGRKIAYEVEDTTFREPTFS